MNFANLHICARPLKSMKVSNFKVKHKCINQWFFKMNFVDFHLFGGEVQNMKVTVVDVYVFVFSCATSFLLCHGPMTNMKVAAVGVFIFDL
jgi:hypothetical protein